MKGNGTDGRAPLQFWANGLNENTLEIKGASGAATGLANENGTLRNDNQTLGFHLAGVDIPHPTGHMCEGSSANCGQTKTYSNLCWVQRCTAEGKVAWVLSLVNGSCPATKTNISCGGSEEEGIYTWVKVENGDDFGSISGSDQNIGECYSNPEGSTCKEHSASEQACRNACFSGDNMADECRTAKSPFALQGGSCSPSGSTKFCNGIFGYLYDGVCICGYAHTEYICK